MVTNSLSYEAVNDDIYHFIEQKNEDKKMEIVRDDAIQADSFDDALSAAGYINDDLWQLDNPRWYGVGGHQADQWLE